MEAQNSQTTLSGDHVYVVPKREILEPADFPKWTKSEAYKEYIGFVECLNVSVRGKSLLYPLTNPSPGIEIMVGVLGKLSSWIDEIPPIDQPQRFGNKAFRTWYSRIVDESGPLLRALFPNNVEKAIPEIELYLTEGFGNSTRIDYGTGHEMSFIMFLYTLFRIGILNIENPDDKIGTVIKIFESYMTLVRKLQMTYRMEPAGSHGAWSLDDFQFVPFIWGSSQLIGHSRLEPGYFPDEATIRANFEEWMFFGCLDYICKNKTGPFHEHSSQLWNISGTSSWTKVNQGLLKMYKAEVLGKFPVIQHTLFGSILSINEAKISKPQDGIFRKPQPPSTTSI